MTNPLQIAEALLQATEHCVVATHGAAGLTCGTMFYGIANPWRLALVSQANSRHIANMLETRECVVVVARVPMQFGEPALQIRAQCRTVVAHESSSGSDIARALYDRFPAASNFFAELATLRRPTVTVAVDIVSFDLLDERTYGVGHDMRIDVVPAPLSEQALVWETPQRGGT
jgi:hypothetical protein